MDFREYKKASYREVYKEINRSFETSEKSWVQVASDIGVNSVQTVKFAIQSSDGQMVSDKVLTGIFAAIKLPAFVMWINGERQYFIKNKN